MLDEAGINVIAANVGLNITRFIEDAGKMGTYLDALNLKLKEISMINISPMMNMSAIDAALARRVSGEAMTDAQIIALRERTNAEIMVLNSQRIMGEADTTARINLIQQEGQLAQARILTEGIRQRRRLEAESLANSQTYFGKMQTLLKHHVGMMASMAVMYGGFDLLKSGIVDFESGMAGVQQTLEETYKELSKTLGPEEMARIADGFSDIAERWGQSSKEILEAGKSWSRQYKNVEEVQNLVNNSVLLSVVDNVALTKSVSALEATLNQWGRTARNAAEANQFSLEIVDKWSALAHKQMATATDLAAANEKTGAVARMVEVDFDHMQGLITASLRATGRSGEELGNMWKSVLASIHTDKSVGELKALGVEAKDLAGNWRPVQDVLGEVMIKMQGTKQDTENLMMALAGGKWQWAKLAASLGDYSTYLSATATSINATGKAHEYMEAQMNTVARKAGQLHQALIGLVNAAGNGGLTGTIKILLDNLRYFVDGLENGGMKAVALGLAVVGVSSLLNKLRLATVAAREAQVAFNLQLAIGDALMGNIVGLIGAAAIVGVTAYTISMGKAADKQSELIEKEKTQLDQHKSMIDQYANEIGFVQELESNRNKLVASMKGMSDTDERKIALNKELEGTEKALSEAVGAEAAANVKNAQYSHSAFQALITSLQGKQKAEQVAWDNSNKVVSNATEHLRKELTTQLELFEKTAKAYSIFGKIQEVQLASQKGAAEQNIKYWEDLSKRPLSMQPPGISVNEKIAEAKKNLADIQDNITTLYDDERTKKMQKIITELNSLGGSNTPVNLPDIPGLGDLGSPREAPDSGTTKTASQLEDLAKKARELAIAMAENKVKAFTDDIRLLDEQFKGNIRSLDYLTRKETDYKNALSATTVERKLVQFQIQSLSSDTGKYGEEIEDLRKKDMDLSVQEASLANNIRETVKAMREVNVTMLESKISTYTDDIKMMDAHMKNFSGDTIGYLLVRQMDYAKAISETRNEQELISSQINELSNDTAKYADEIESLTKKAKELDLQEQDLTSKRDELIASKADEAITSLRSYYENQKALDDQSYTDKVDNLDNIHQKIMENLDTELAKQEETINSQIQAIDRLVSAEDYNKNLKKSQAEAQDIQNQISYFSRDTSFEGKARVADLQKQLAEKNSSIEDMQSTHSDDLRRQNLQDQLAAIKKVSDARKAAETASYNATKATYAADKKLADEKYNNMMADEQHWAGVKKAIIEGNIKDINTALTKFSDGFTADLTAKAKEIDKSFKAIIDTINAVKSAASSVSATVEVNSGGSPITGAATGGRTTSFGSQGKLALLHQNELITNADDSNNILKALRVNNVLMSSLRNMDLSSILSASLPSIRTPQLAASSVSHVTVPTKIEFHVTSTDGIISKKNLELASNYVIKQIEKGQTIRGR